MKLYQKYIITTYVKSFLRSLLFLSAILIAIQTLNIANDLANESIVNINDIAIVSFHIIPYIIYSIIPLSTALTTALVIFELLSTLQLTILRNAGVSIFQICKTQAIAIVPIFFIMLTTSFFILPKTAQVRTEIQNSIIKSKIKNFITPESVKTLNGITIITSPYNSLKHIPLTFIHQETNSGEFVFVGNIQETWSNHNMLGIEANNATILSTKFNETGETLIKFQKLETQINFFLNQASEEYLKHLTLPQLIQEYQTQNDSKYIKEINNRIIPAFSTLLLMFAMTTLMILLYKNRSKYTKKDITIMAFVILYIMLSTSNINEIFHEKQNFWLAYVNIILTFVIIYFFGKKSFSKKKYV